MRKQDSSRIKIGDELTVKQRQWYYVGSGEAVKTDYTTYVNTPFKYYVRELPP